MTMVVATVATAVAKTAVVACMLWVLIMPLIGGSSWGKHVLSNWASNSIFDDKKAGVPMLMLCVPILTAGTIATLFASTKTTATTTASTSSTTTSNKSRFYRGSSNNNNNNPRWYTVVLIFVPCIVYMVSSLRRHLKNLEEMSTDEIIMESANVFGMVSVIVMSWLLIPVVVTTGGGGSGSGSDGGPVGKLLQRGWNLCCCYCCSREMIPPWWDPMTFIQQFHMWSGRIVVVASLVHGIMHSIRYLIQSPKVFWSYMFPPVQCWTNPQSYQPEICEDEDVTEDGTNECTCYDHFVPFTGWVAGFGLLMIGLSSLYRVRRKQFVVFATLHYLMSPIVIIMICIHYNKAVLYVSGGTLYYLACNAPRWVEQWWKNSTILTSSSCRQTNVSRNVALVSIERIDPDPSHWDRPCLAITMKATDEAIRQYQPGMYGLFKVPSISRISHPFTINRVFVNRSQNNQGQNQNLIRIICRVTGRFTKSLEAAITRVGSNHHHSIAKKKNGNGTGANTVEQQQQPNILLPDIIFSGWYGSERMVEIIQSHDAIVIVAAGVGITPYLTVIAKLLQGINDPVVDSTGRDGIMMNNSAGNKKVVLHWICRDKALVDYCRNEYFDLSSPLTTSMTDDERQVDRNSKIDININIHLTSTNNQDDDESFEDNNATTSSCDFQQSPDVSPVATSAFVNSAEKITDNIGPCVLFASIAWGGAAVIWYMYQRQEKEAFVQRLVTVVAVLIFTIIVAVAANFCSNILSPKYYGWYRVANDEAIDSDQDAPNPFSDISEGNIELGVRNDDRSSSFQDSMGFDDGFERNKERRDQLSTEPSEKEDPRSLITVSQGRPSLTDVLDVLQEGQSPALMCCVTRGLEQEIRGLMKNRRLGSSNSSPAPIYSESFEV
mmetsp:Transcript_62548/g.152286  ORF Transcript_62548/g.152286 Transcript_62548/m.152286 type:complete len:890 (-) Transcript_62548:21-2690(-)